ncbi:hypothetical protein LIS04_06 [Listeria phage LIS04]|nr:hypothetical protein LIS04_06 [Listeria phage LIS04]
MTISTLLQTEEFSVVSYGDPSPSLHPLAINRLAYEKALSTTSTIVRKCKSITQTETHVIVNLLIGRAYQSFKYKISDIASLRFKGVKMSSSELAEVRGFSHCSELFDAAKFIANDLGYTVGCSVIEYRDKYKVELVKDGVSKYFTIKF